MAARPLVLCYSFVTPPKPAPEMVKDLFSRHYGEYFTLVDQKSVTDLSEKERETMRGLLVTGGRKSHMDIVGKETMDLFPNLKVISTSSTGIDIIDVEAASERGIRVGHSPGHFCSDSVADFAFGLLLTCARSILRLNKKSREVRIHSYLFWVEFLPPVLGKRLCACTPVSGALTKYFALKLGVPAFCCLHPTAAKGGAPKMLNHL